MTFEWLLLQPCGVTLKEDPSSTSSASKSPFTITSVNAGSVTLKNAPGTVSEWPARSIGPDISAKLASAQPFAGTSAARVMAASAAGTPPTICSSAPLKHVQLPGSRNKPLPAEPVHVALSAACNGSAAITRNAATRYPRGPFPLRNFSFTFIFPCLSRTILSPSVK